MDRYVQPPEVADFTRQSGALCPALPYLIPLLPAGFGCKTGSRRGSDVDNSLVGLDPDRRRGGLAVLLLQVSGRSPIVFTPAAFFCLEPAIVPAGRRESMH